MSIYTVAELTIKIKEVDAQIEKAQATKEYELDTGQGTQQVKRQSLADLIKLRDYWLNELQKIDTDGLIYANFNR